MCTSGKGNSSFFKKNIFLNLISRSIPEMFSESHTEKFVEYGASQLLSISGELSLKPNVSEETQEQLAKKSPDNFESCFVF